MRYLLVLACLLAVTFAVPIHPRALSAIASRGGSVSVAVEQFSATSSDSLDVSGPNDPTFSSFLGWSKAYRSEGTVALHVSIGGNPPIAPDVVVPASITVDPSVGYVINVTTTVQWTFLNGSYLIIGDPSLAGLCFFDGSGYANEVSNYKNVLHTGRASFTGQPHTLDIYEGQVKDVGSCDGVINSAFGLWKGAIQRWSFSQSAPAGNIGTCNYGETGKIKVGGVLNMPNINFGTPHAKHFQLPQECLNPFGTTLFPYCAPNGFFCYPYVEAAC